MTAPPSHTYAALLTPNARGAIATVAVRGEGAAACAGNYFTSFSRVPLAEAAVGRILVGQWKGADEEIGEELVVARVDEQTVEIHCHGGLQASRRILDHLAAEGCEICTWQEWTRRQNADPIAAEAIILLPTAPTERTALHLLDQYQGAFTEAIARIETALLTGERTDALQQTEKLRELAPFGRHLTEPWSVVLAGPPNVGKSSLLNRIVGYDRAIVLDMPGTTRDVLNVLTALDGWPVRFSDTAGIRVSEDELEQAGIAKAKEALKQADLVIVLHDAANLQPDELDVSLRELPSALHVVNKTDLVPGSNVPAEMLATSALTGQGVPELISAIVGRLVPEVPASGQALPFTRQQEEILAQVNHALQQEDAATAIALLRTLN